MTMRLVIGLAAGAAVGYLIHKLIGCPTGGCPITANPWSSIVYGMVMGGLVAATG